MRIRNLQQGDAGQISNLVGECGPYVAPYNDYAYWMLENYYYSTCLAAEKEGRIVGFVSGMPSVERNCIFIWQLCVREDFRQQGIAGALLDSLLIRARNLNLRGLNFQLLKAIK